LIIARRVWHAYAAVNRRDFDLVLLGWHPESEYRPSADLMPPDVEPIFHGHDGMRQLWRYWLDARGRKRAGLSALHAPTGPGDPARGLLDRAEALEAAGQRQ
jgi:hypothetical protein